MLLKKSHRASFVKKRTARLKTRGLQRVVPENSSPLQKDQQASERTRHSNRYADRTGTSRRLPRNSMTERSMTSARNPDKPTAQHRSRSCPPTPSIATDSIDPLRVAQNCGSNNARQGMPTRWPNRFDGNHRQVPQKPPVSHGHADDHRSNDAKPTRKSRNKRRPQGSSLERMDGVWLDRNGCACDSSG